MGQVTLRGVRKRFGDVEIVAGIDLEVRDGELPAFVGPSGCGKSTTLRMTAGLESISEGDLPFGGERPNDIHPAERGCAMVFPRCARYPHMTVAENKGFALKVAGAPLALCERPANEFVAGIRGAPRINFVPRPDGVAPAGAVRCGLRPENLGVDLAGTGVAAEVAHAEHLGDASILHLRVAGVEALQTAKVAAGSERAVTGQRVGLVPAPAWTLGFDSDGRSVG